MSHVSTFCFIKIEFAIFFLHYSAKSGAPPTQTPLYHPTWCTVASSVILGSSVIIGYIIKSLNGVAPYYAKPQ